jgi:hypothetical protein
MSGSGLGRRRFLTTLGMAAAATALAACATASPVPTAVPTEAPRPTETPKPTVAPLAAATATAVPTVPPTATQAPTATAMPTATLAPTATVPPTATVVPTVTPTTIPPKPGTIQHFVSANNGFSFDYPGEWVPMKPKDQLIVAESLAVEDVRLGQPEGPWLRACATVFPVLGSMTVASIAEEMQMTRLACGSSPVKLVSAKALQENATNLLGTDLTVEVARESGTYQSRQIVMRRQVNMFRVGFDVSKGTMEKNLKGLDLVLTTLKTPGLPSFKEKLPWVDIPV